MGKAFVLMLAGRGSLASQHMSNNTEQHTDNKEQLPMHSNHSISLTIYTVCHMTRYNPGTFYHELDVSFNVFASYYTGGMGYNKASMRLED